MREWLKNERISKGMTMKQVAGALHISESYYCSIENGYRKRNMDISLADKIASLFGISIKQVLQNEELDGKGSEQ